MYTSQQLDFASKYPFTEEARQVIREMDMKTVDMRHVTMGKARLEEAFQNGKIEYREMNYGKADQLISYVYARMLVSVLKNTGLIMKYSAAEARRAAAALEMDSPETVLKVAGSLGVDVQKKDRSFSISFVQYLSNTPANQEFGLVNQNLSGGMVMLDSHSLTRVLEAAITRAVERGLPIKTSEMPKAVVDVARSVKLPVVKMEFVSSGRGIGWIDRLMSMAISDARHRTVNIILAPYLVNVKGLSVERAAEVISNYIALCRKVNPDTKITDRYIRYQCEYAKSHGIRPMSLKRARTELGGSIDFNLLLGEEEREEA